MHLIQIVLCEFHNDIILPVATNGFVGDWYDEGRVIIGDKLLIKYIPKHINPTRNRNNITYECETYICAIFIKYDLNEWWLRLLENFDNLHHNAARDRIGQR